MLSGIIGRQPATTSSSWRRGPKSCWGRPASWAPAGGRAVGAPAGGSRGVGALADSGSEDVYRARSRHWAVGAVPRLLRPGTDRPHRLRTAHRADGRAPGAAAHAADAGDQAGRRGPAPGAALGAIPAARSGGQLPLLRATHGTRQFAEPRHPRASGRASRGYRLGRTVL